MKIFLVLFSFSLFAQLVIAENQHVISAKNDLQNIAYNVNLKSLFNNKGTADFDGAGNNFKCSSFTQSSSVSIGSIDYKLSRNDQGEDNVIALKQLVTLPNAKLGALYMLGSVNHGPVNTEVVIVYQDGSETTTTLSIPDWQVRHAQQIERLDILSCRLNNGFDATLASIPLVTDPSKNVSHLILPYTNPLYSYRPALHIYSMTAVPAASNKVKIISAKGTRRWWENTKAGEYQIVAVKIQNISPDWISDLSVFIEGSLLKTKYHGNIKRLAPGHIITVEVAILTLRRLRQPTQILIEVIDSLNHTAADIEVFDNVEVGLEDYDATIRSLEKHTTPSWFQSAKFGIFVHWGVYSVPSWAPVGKEYAEWYWWNYNQKFSLTYHYHRSFYGPDLEYDDFIDMWKPDQFSPSAWLDLIDASGAKYFVFTSKHHDGIALFDTKVNNRSTVKMNPRRNFVKELLDEAKKSYPHLKRGIYFSLPEWFHSSYHDRSINWDGPPRNPYTGETVPYTGAAAVEDFVNDVQVPQFLELIHDYEPDIMWCDIGGINNSTAWQATFLNNARKQGRQVTFNDRCGNSVSDFATVEYQGVGYVPERFWESTRGIDPHSFGFNHETKPYQYASTVSLLRELVTTLSKGGNFLLNIGPESSGLLPNVMVNVLLQMGKWIDKVHDAIFDSVPYWVTTSDLNEPGQPLYFTQSKNGNSIFVFSFERPFGQRLIIKATLPLHPNSKISLLGKKRSTYLDWHVISNGSLFIDVPDYILDDEKLIWVFQINTP